MARLIKLGGRPVGDGHPVYVIAEIGINHNGDLNIAEKLIDAAKEAGCDAVKFQKRNPERCVPPDIRDKMRDTPWGYITYLDYRYKVEFQEREYREIDRYCRKVGIDWFASCWDVDSVNFMEQFSPAVHKIPSAMLTNRELLERVRETGRPVILSTGMSSEGQVHAAVNILDQDRLLLAHTNSTYPCPLNELNLRVILTLRQKYQCPIGYSGHEIGLTTTVASVAIGANFIERHITLDRAMWGSDQSASVEPHGFKRLIKDIRSVENALGDGQKRVYEGEAEASKRLRLVDNLIG